MKDAMPSQFFPLYLRARGTLDARAQDAAAAVPARRAVFEDKAVIVPADTRVHESCLLVRGMTVRRHRAPGGGPVISSICVPGDFMDLHSLLLHRIDHDIVSVGGTAVEFVPHDALEALCLDEPDIARLLWAETLLDAQAHRTWIVLANAMRASERIAHLFCELEFRLSQVGLAEMGNFTLPLTQGRVGEVTGYTPIHVNRAVGELRAAGLLEWTGREVSLPDIGRIRAFCGFEPGYLDRIPNARSADQ